MFVEISVPRRVLISDELRELSAKSKHLTYIVSALYLTLVLVVAVHRLMPDQLYFPTLIPLFLVFALIQYVLLHAAHESVHQVSRGKKLENTCSALFLMYPLGLTPSFRAEHLKHHAHFGLVDKDPDLAVYGNFPRSKVEFLKYLARGFSGVAAIKQAMGRSLNGESPANNGMETLLLVLFHLLLLATTTALVGNFYYLMWVISLLTAVKGLAQIRGLAEHGNPLGDPFVLRGFFGRGALARFVGSIGFSHHAEHHLFPNVPFDRLETVRSRILDSDRQAGFDRTVVELFDGTHLSLLVFWFRSLPLR